MAAAGLASMRCGARGSPRVSDLLLWTTAGRSERRQQSEPIEPLSRVPGARNFSGTSRAGTGKVRSSSLY